jgi:uncharacterized protein YcbX
LVPAIIIRFPEGNTIPSLAVRLMIQLSQINIYPVKSCKGISLSRAELTPYGLADDRRWMIIDSHGTFVSQRSTPKMALIEPLFTGSSLKLAAPDLSLLEVPLQQEGSTKVNVRIWDDLCDALDCGDSAARWFSQFLDMECRLVEMGGTFDRPVNTKYAMNGDLVGFADAFPLLLISTASLRDLNSRLEMPVPMNRFRPNLVIDGCKPYEEDTWRRISIGNVTFRVSKPCSRCTVPTVDQATGMRGHEPLKTLSAYRKGNNEKVFFGQNLVHEQKSGELAVGSKVLVLQ